MSKTQEDIGADLIDATGGDGVQLSSQAVQPYESLLAAVPDAGGAGYDGILAQIAAATTVEELDAPWRTFDTDALIGVPLVIQSIAKSPSSYLGGLGHFLVVHGAFRQTGEAVTFTTGAVGIVAQLVKAFAIGAFPLNATVRESAGGREGRNAPQYLEINR